MWFGQLPPWMQGPRVTPVQGQPGAMNPAAMGMLSSMLASHAPMAPQNSGGQMTSPTVAMAPAPPPDAQKGGGGGMGSMGLDGILSMLRFMPMGGFGGGG